MTGTFTIKWLHGESGSSLFLQQDMEMDYGGTKIVSREIIGYDPKTDKFPSQAQTKTLTRHTTTLQRV